MKKILITGGAGFIGQHLTRKLVDKGYRVVILDNLSKQIHGDNPEIPDFNGVDFFKGDVRDKDLLLEILPEIDAIYHLASETGTAQSMYEIERYVDVNVNGTSILIEAVAETNLKGIDFILSSSRSIYGEGAYLSKNNKLFYPKSREYDQLSRGKWQLVSENGEELRPTATTEDSIPSPSSIYAATKYSQEMIVSIASTSLGMRSSILRFQNVFGEGQSLRNPYTGIISIFFNRIRQGLPINIYEDGEESRDFIYIDDIVDSLISSLERESMNNITVNVGSGKQTSVSQLASMIIEISGISAEKKITGDFRVGDIRHCFADLTKAKKELSFEPKYSLRKGLIRFCLWAEKQPIYEDKSEIALSELKDKGL